MISLTRILLALPNAAIRMSCDWQSRPTTYDPAAFHPALHALETSFRTIKWEFEQALPQLQISPLYHVVDRVQKRISGAEDQRHWRVLFLEAMGRKFNQNRSLMPRTAELIDKIPNVFQAFVSRLDPAKSVPEHTSPYAGYLRYHLSLEIPRVNPPYMLINELRVDWTEGKGFLFDDTFPHSIVNNSAEFRAVLIVDIERPTRSFGRIVNRAIVTCLRYSHAKLLARRLHATGYRN